MCLQGLEARKGDGVPIEEWTNEFIYVASLSFYNEMEAKRKRVLTARLAACVRPEAKRACPDQDEAEVKLCGGPNRLVVQNLRMN